MNRSRVFVYGAVALVVGVTVLSGPAIGLVDLTSPRFDTAGLGQGSATVDRVDAPDSATIDRGFQSKSYRLEVPEARARVTGVEGKPVLVYRIHVPGLGFTRASNYFLDGDSEGWTTLSLDGSPIEPEAVSTDRYTATLSVVLRTTDGESVVYNESIPVEVTG